MGSSGSGKLGLAALVMLFPIFGFAALRAPAELAVLAVCLSTGTGLVLAATDTARPPLRSVLAETVVRAG